jgi:hypothetical protein
MGLFGLSGKTLIPMEIARVDEQERRIEVAASKDQAKNAPHYHDDDDINHEFEAKIRDHFGLERQQASPERGTYGRYIGATVDEGDAPSGTAGATPLLIPRIAMSPWRPARRPATNGGPKGYFRPFSDSFSR